MTTLVTSSTYGELGSAFFMILSTSNICSLDSFPAINIWKTPKHINVIIPMTAPLIASSQLASVSILSIMSNALTAK